VKKHLAQGNGIGYGDLASSKKGGVACKASVPLGGHTATDFTKAVFLCPSFGVALLGRARWVSERRAGVPRDRPCKPILARPFFLQEELGVISIYL